MQEQLCSQSMCQLMAMAGIASSFYGFEKEAKAIYQALPAVIVTTELLHWIQSVMLLGEGQVEQAKARLQRLKLSEATSLLKLLES